MRRGRLAGNKKRLAGARWKVGQEPSDSPAARRSDDSLAEPNGTVHPLIEIAETARREKIILYPVHKPLQTIENPVECEVFVSWFSVNWNVG
jgi:hypothetical protein